MLKIVEKVKINFKYRFPITHGNNTKYRNGKKKNGNSMELTYTVQDCKVHNF